MPNTQPGPGWLSLLRNPAVALPVAAALGGLLVAVVLEGPKLVAHAISDPARIIQENRAATSAAAVLNPPPTLGPLTPVQQQARAARLKATYGDTCLYDETPVPQDYVFMDSGKHPCVVLPGMTVQPAPAKGG